MVQLGKRELTLIIHQVIAGVVIILIFFVPPWVQIVLDECVKNKGAS
jgi:hypothetical protein